MTCDAITARDQTFDLVKIATDTSLPDVEVRYEGMEKDDPPARDAKWIRLSFRHIDGHQASLAGATGARRWSRQGLVTAQCFAPLSDGGLEEAMRMASVVRDALQGAATEDGVWFRDPSIQEIGKDAGWYNVNATIQFNYDEVR